MRLAFPTRGYIIAGVIAALAGIIGYSRIFHDLDGLLLLCDRPAAHSIRTYGAHDWRDGCGLQLARGEMRMVSPHILKVQSVRRLPEVSAEVLHGADVDFLGVRRHVADRHVVDYA